MVASIPSNKRSSRIRGNSEQIPKTMTTRKTRNLGKKMEHENLELGENLVGSEIEVWWPIDRKFYPAVVDSYDPGRNKHKVLYGDGDEEILNLKRQKWKHAVHEPVEKSYSGKEAVGQSSSSRTSLQEKKQSSDADSVEVKHSTKGEPPAQKMKDLGTLEKSQGHDRSASVSNSENENALSGEEGRLLDNCVIALNKLEDIDGSKYAKFAKALHKSAAWRKMFMLMPDHRKKDMVLYY